MSDTDIRRRKQDLGIDMAKLDEKDEDKKKLLETKHFSRSDIESIALLSVLYTLQGIPMGLSASVPLLLANKVGYSAQAMFSFCSWPFSLKLLWAPIVDSVYIKSMGRRKSWLVPVQLLCGLMMVLGSFKINHWIGDDPNEKPNTAALTTYFFGLYFLMATQDIAVDGWALTMLSEGNVGYASTCNSVGQTLGYFIAFIGFIALNDPATCNKYLRNEQYDKGIVSLAGFIQFWGYIFLITTIFVWIFKTEAPEKSSNKEDISEESSSSSSSQYDSESGQLLSKKEKDIQVFSNVSPIDDNVGVLEAYSQLIRVLKLPAMSKLCMILLSCKIAFAVTDAATTLKFVEYGVPKEQLAYFAPAFVGIGVVVPLVIGRYTNGPRPMSIFLVGVPLRILSGIFLALVLNHTKSVFNDNGSDPGNKFWTMFLISSAFNNVAVNLMFVAQMSFFAQISDPAIGGTYMTLLNTIANLGSKWPTSISLALLDSMTYRSCTAPESVALDRPPHELEMLDCPAVSDFTNPCAENGGICVTTADGYSIQLVLCTCLGILWLIMFAKKILQLEQIPKSKWIIS